MNQQLTKEYNEQEAKVAIKQMYPLFFQYFWPTYGDVVSKTVLDFLNQGISPPNFHETYIVLIPKVKEPKRVIDYKPISLCNVVYKIVSKVLLCTEG